MKTGKKLALMFGVATGAAVALMAFGKAGKRARNYFVKKESIANHDGSDLYDESDINYT